MENSAALGQRSTARRSFLKGGVFATGALVSSGLFGAASALAQPADDDDRDGNEFTDGDAAILRFLAAAELIEADLWTQYAELGGVQDNTDTDVPGTPTGGSAAYIAALQTL